MNYKLHFLIAIACFGAIIYELNMYYTIMGHPYMICLISVLSIAGGYNLGAAICKKFLN